MNRCIESSLESIEPVSLPSFQMSGIAGLGTSLYPVSVYFPFHRLISNGDESCDWEDHRCPLGQVNICLASIARPAFSDQDEAETTWHLLYTMRHNTCYLPRDHFAFSGYGMIHAGCFSILIKYTFVKSFLTCTMEYVEAGVSRCSQMFRRLNYILHVT